MTLSHEPGTTRHRLLSEASTPFSQTDTALDVSSPSDNQSARAARSSERGPRSRVSGPSLRQAGSARTFQYTSSNFGLMNLGRTAAEPPGGYGLTASPTGVSAAVRFAVRGFKLS